MGKDIRQRNISKIPGIITCLGGYGAIIAGFAAGFVNGLLGAGGGVILIKTLSSILPDNKKRSSRDVFSMALAVMLPISAVSSISYARLGVWSGDGALEFIIPAVLGGILGALLLDKLNTKWLKLIFSAVAAFSGIMMLFKS